MIILGRIDSILKGVKEAAEEVIPKAIDGAAQVAMNKFGVAGAYAELTEQGNKLTRFFMNSPTGFIKTGIVRAPMKIIKEAPDMPLGYKLSGYGYALAAGTIAYSTAKGAVQEHNREKIGSVSGPLEIPLASYDYAAITEADTGASGDLVFALNKLRSR